ncbi:MAG: alpha/beta hydrolase [Gammaproteobacteria bacterium]|jgi:pimeloyl-ACP methyl ester carboxylesterase|nr:alpha/beta hydrolase [Gammaproteobacteria bacterium]
MSNARGAAPAAHTVPDVVSHLLARYECGLVDMAGIWRDFAEDLTTAPIALAGHRPQEEQPSAVNAALTTFLALWQG